MTKHTMQAALAWSPCNKAYTTHNGDAFIVQANAQGHFYRLWIVPESDVPVWEGLFSEREIDGFPGKYQIDPGARVWTPMGLADDLRLYTLEEAFTTMLKTLETTLTWKKAQEAERVDCKPPFLTGDIPMSFETKHTKWAEWTALVVFARVGEWHANIYRPVGDEMEVHIKTGLTEGQLRETLTLFDAPAQLEWKDGQPG